MHWECTECGTRVSASPPPIVCGECGIAGARFVVADEAPEDTERLSAWLHAGVERRAMPARWQVP